MPAEHWDAFRPGHRFPADLLAQADEELEQFVTILETHGVRVYRPEKVDWFQEGGYTAAMPRDGLLSVGNTLIEAPFAWPCRRHEMQLAFAPILDELARDPTVRVVRAPEVTNPDALFEGVGARRPDGTPGWAINDARPAFDAADFTRCGHTLVGQLSHVTNRKGVESLRAAVPAGYAVELLDVTDSHAMHIDATLLPLRPGLLVYNPERVSEAALRRLAVFRDWELKAYPHQPAPRKEPPRYMTSGWLLMNVLSLDE